MDSAALTLPQLQAPEMPWAPINAANPSALE
jgi:hypothetical protein